VASINFITAHDGFTLADLVSYNGKHNEANGEGGRDGTDDNRSWNCGVEGPSDDPEVTALRARQQRNFLATMLLSQGVPMISHGDELGRTQQGNNNAYCQDSPLSWVDWAGADTNLIDFTTSVARLRRYHPTFRRRRFFDGRPVARGQGEPLPDIVWMTPAGDAMTDADWDADFGRSIAVFLNGRGIRGTDERGQAIVDDSFLLLFNAHDDALKFALPPEEYGAAWNTVIDTAGIDEDERRHLPQQAVTVAGRGMVVLQEAGIDVEPAVPDTPPAADVPDVPPVIQSNGE
jgi:glycogen operon protein